MNKHAALYARMLMIPKRCCWYVDMMLLSSTGKTIVSFRNYGLFALLLVLQNIVGFLFGFMTTIEALTVVKMS